MNKPVLYGSDGRLVSPRLAIRDRLAPKPRANLGLEGWVEWQLIDHKGHALQGGEQHNLILDSFLNYVAENTLANGVLSNLSNALTHFAVGTGSTPPTVADTALEAQVGARTMTLIEYGSTSPNQGVVRYTLEREFDFAQGNGNLTEFGFAAGASSSILVRELFRDGSGEPITITKTSDYKLRIKYILDLTVSPLISDAAPHAFTVAGIGPINCSIGFTTHFANVVSLFARAAVADSNRLGAVFASNQSSLNYASPVSGVESHRGALTFAPYVPGTFQRTADALFGTAAANNEIASVLLSGFWSGTNRLAGLACIIDSGDRFTKDDLHTLAIDEVFTISWGRA